MTDAPASGQVIPAITWRGESVPAPPVGLLAVWLAAWVERGGSVLHLTREERRARALADAVRALSPDSEVLLLPPWDCLPYDRAAPSRAVMGARMAVLGRLAAPRPETGRIVLTTVEAAAQRLPPASALPGTTVEIESGASIDVEELRRFLVRVGYVMDERVDEPGEAAARGNVLDLFPADASSPLRIEIAGDQVVSLRTYDPLTQRSLEELRKAAVGPASELVLPPETSESDLADGDPHRLPVAYGRLATLFDHVRNPRIVADIGVDQTHADFTAQVEEAYELRPRLTEGALGVPLPPPVDPKLLYIPDEEWGELLGSHAHIRLTVAGEAVWPNSPALRAERNPRAATRAFVRGQLEAKQRVVLATADPVAQRRLRQLAGIPANASMVRLARWADAADLEPGTVAMLSVPLPSGFLLPGLTVLTPGDVLLAEPTPTPGGDRGLPLIALDTFRPGDHVVHAEHGIGILRRLERVEANGVSGEHLDLEYAGQQRLFVPALDLARVWRYGTGDAEVGLDRLDGTGWQARRDEVADQITKAAASLARLSRERAISHAHALTPPREAYARFVRRFPYTPSDDQAAAIEVTLADLARGSPPLDRLVCGDVGFGKTEVALRAAAAAALNGRQVVLLAPTTLLVRQHLATFRRRFAGLDVRVEQLSRLGRTREARDIRQGLRDGSVRIVIGTHALLSPQLRFHDLALVIIDEEQRFGTRHKAALRRLRHGVHALTMSATPIPRTLQAALAGLQELSVIATAPVRRQPVRTLVLPFDGSTVHEALVRERRRGGRSFVVVPRIADLEPMSQRLAALAANLDVAVVHGRMPADQLDRTVLDFADGHHDVLLTTSIIETGLDIPGADTMIVWQPERFGLAQLHQLRGRVGRGRRRATVYLMHESSAGLTGAAEQRLRTMAAFERLGAGFAISARDLDLRGAGDLVGAEQAGHVKLIGTGLYEHLLVRALRRERGEPVAEEWWPDLELGIDALVPNDYVPEPELRLELYDRVARLEHADDLADLAEEVRDRFGPPPVQVEQLWQLSDLRLRCRRHGIAKLEAGPKAVAATFRNEAESERQWPTTDDRNERRLCWSAGRLIMAQTSETPAGRLAAAAAFLDCLVGSGGAQEPQSQ